MNDKNIDYTNLNSPKNKKNYKRRKGGKVLASGGFGCVFKPSLICEGQNKRKSGTVSKLMLKKYALAEYDEIKNIQNILDEIPNYTNYFLINDFSVCIPSELNKEDLHGYKRKCKAFKKDKITKGSLNDAREKLMILNMPDGGNPLDDYIYKNNFDTNLSILNESMIELLNKGILPMNKLNVFHSDIKESNILVQVNGSELNTRLIDWGLSVNYIPFKNDSFPHNWRNRPLQFNIPFSIILFTDDFYEKYSDYLKDGGKLDQNSLEPFVFDYIRFWFKKRGPGHYMTVNDIMFMLFGKDINTTTYSSMNQEQKARYIESEYTIVYLINYIVEILIHFTNFKEDGTLDLRVYLDKVFIKIIDIWGFLISYLPILEILSENYDKLNANEMEIFELIKYMYLTYLYNPRIETINMKNLNTDLNKLTKLLGNNNDSFKNRIDTLFQKKKTNRSSSSKSSTKKSTTNKNNLTKRIRTKFYKATTRRNKSLKLLSP
jgi:hypothetical protein